MKLTAAKCPSCGASIEVDRNEETTICEYCKSNIIIEDAVQKLKIELSGKVKVSGIKDNEDRLKDAINYYELDEFKDATATLNTIIADEPFNIDAHIWLVKTNVKQFNQLYDDDEYKTDSEYNKAFWDDVDFILSNYDRLLSIDKKSIHKKKLKDEEKVLEKAVKESEKELSDLEECTKIDEIIDEITSYKFNDKISKTVKRDYRHINPLIISFFNEKLGCDLLSMPGKNRCAHRDMTLRYMDKNSKLQTKEITTCKTLKEVEEVLNSNKEELFNQIDKMAKNPKPIRALKSMLRK